jgi:hypothetical protein
MATAFRGNLDYAAISRKQCGGAGAAPDRANARAGFRRAEVLRLRTKKNIYAVIAIITPGIISLLMEKRGLSLERAADVLYGSRLYEVLEDEGTKLWRFSHTVLYDMLEEELETGNVTFPEEQI